MSGMGLRSQGAQQHSQTFDVLNGSQSALALGQREVRSSLNSGPMPDTAVVGLSARRRLSRDHRPLERD